MKKKSERGYTGIDIAISLVVLFIFVSLIATMSYEWNSSINAIKLKAEATQIAVEKIEKLKNELTFEEIENMRNYEFSSNKEVKTGFYETISIQDYADINAEKIPELVKKVTVKIQYKFKKEIQTIELSTIVSKEI